MSRTNARVLVAVLCAGLLTLAAALPASGAPARPAGTTHGHGLVKKLPKRWLRAHELKGSAAAPLADPDRDGACNWVELRQRTNPLRPNAVATTPSSTTPAPSTRVIRLHGIVGQVTPTSFTLALEHGLTVQVALPAGAPVVDEQGAPMILSLGQRVMAFVSQAADLSISALIVFAEDGQEGEDEGDHDDGDGARPPSQVPPVSVRGDGRGGQGPGDERVGDD